MHSQNVIDSQVLSKPEWLDLVDESKLLLLLDRDDRSMLLILERNDKFIDESLELGDLVDESLEDFLTCPFFLFIDVTVAALEVFLIGVKERATLDEDPAERALESMEFFFLVSADVEEPVDLADCTFFFREGGVSDLAALPFERELESMLFLRECADLVELSNLDKSISSSSGSSLLLGAVSDTSRTAARRICELFLSTKSSIFNVVIAVFFLAFSNSSVTKSTV